MSPSNESNSDSGNPRTFSKSMMGEHCVKETGGNMGLKRMNSEHGYVDSTISKSVMGEQHVMVSKCVMGEQYVKKLAEAGA